MLFSCDLARVLALSSQGWVHQPDRMRGRWGAFYFFLICGFEYLFLQALLCYNSHSIPIHPFNIQWPVFRVFTDSLTLVCVYSTLVTPKRNPVPINSHTPLSYPQP